MRTNCIRTSTLLIILFALMFVFQSCATQEMTAKAPEGTLLTHDELISLFSETHEANHNNSRGISTIKYTPDGQTIAKGSFFDTGKYRIEDDLICSSWVKNVQDLPETKVFQIV